MSSLFDRIKECHNPLPKKTLQKCKNVFFFTLIHHCFSHFLKQSLLSVYHSCFIGSPCNSKNSSPAQKQFEKIIKLFFYPIKRVINTCCPTFSMSHFPRSATSCKSVVFFNLIFPVMLFVNLHILLLKMQIVKPPSTNSIPV